MIFYIHRLTENPRAFSNFSGICLIEIIQPDYLVFHTTHMRKLTLFGLQALRLFSPVSLLTTMPSEQAFPIPH